MLRQHAEYFSQISFQVTCSASVLSNPPPKITCLATMLSNASPRSQDRASTNEISWISKVSHSPGLLRQIFLSPENQSGTIQQLDAEMRYKFSRQRAYLIPFIDIFLLIGRFCCVSQEN
jgi:hypothetical protein